LTAFCNHATSFKRFLPFWIVALADGEPEVLAMTRSFTRDMALWLLMCGTLTLAIPLRAVVLWSDLGATLAHETGAGSDILGGAVKRNDTSSDTLYFKFHVDPLSDVSTELYSAAFQLFEGNEERLALGNSLKAWAYSAFNTAETGVSNDFSGDFDLLSSRHESVGLGSFRNYELPRRGIERTIVFKVQYIPGGDDLVTVWLNPDLAAGVTEASQADTLTTRFTANASFDEVRLRHGGGGGGWTFSDMAIATSFNDFVTARNAESNDTLRLTFQTWQREQGLPQNSVRALAQTRDGYLWIGNDDGLARFDGVRFVSFGISEGLSSGPVSGLFGDSRGALWIGTVGGGLTRRRDGQFTTYTIHDGLPSDSITALAEDNEGRLWIGTEAGLAICENGHLTTLAAAGEFSGRAISTLFKDRRGTMWLGARGAGVFHFLGGKFMPVTDPSVDDLLKDPHCVLVDQSVRIWIGAGDDFVLCREGDQWHRYRIPRHLTRPYVSALAEESDGTVWAGSVSEGLFQFKGGKLTAFNANSGLADNFVESLLVDRENNLWVGTGAGLNRLRRGNLSVLGQSEGLGYGAVQGLAEISPGVIWAGKPSDGLYQWEGRVFNRLDADLSRRYPEVNSLLTARDGSCWAACVRGLLHFENPKSDAAEIEQPALVGENVISLTEDRAGVIWAGTREGQLWQRRGGIWMTPANFSQPHAITSMTQDADGSMWLGTGGGGLYRFKDGVRAHFDRSGGLLSNLIRTLYRDAQGALWIGTAGGGLCRWRDGRMTSFTTREGLPDNTISQILEDDADRLWLGSNRGIACVRKRDLEELAAGKVAITYPRVFGRAEGMLSEECTGGFFPAGLKIKSGQLWFSTLKGIVVVNPRLNATDVPAPKVVLEEVLVDGVLSPDFRLQSSTNDPGNALEPKPGVLHIPPGKHRLELRYTGPSFNAPERVRFRYRLEGLDQDWVEAGANRSVTYPYVPPGEYRFRVIACNGDGAWNESGAEISLNVLPHFWQTWWFIGLAAVGFVALVGSAIRYVERRKHQRRLAQLEQERALERERARIAQDLHDDLGSSLARISLLSGLVRADKENPAQVETHAGKIFQSADQTVRALEEIVWAVRPGSDTLQSLVEYIAHFANELFEGNPTRCRLDLPHDLPALALPPDVRHNIFLIVKEALTNALKHAGAKEVRVQAKAAGSTIEIVVEDDGKGFAPSITPAADKRNGLGNMRQRAATMGGQLDLQSAPGSGTSVRLTVNLALDRTNGRA
jgi:ligand-binding sensor domain-containing protein/signal transduction histidine kinase